jgi:hypothetical protein
MAQCIEAPSLNPRTAKKKELYLFFNCNEKQLLNKLYALHIVIGA